MSTTYATQLDAQALLDLLPSLAMDHRVKEAIKTVTEDRRRFVPTHTVTTFSEMLIRCILYCGRLLDEVALVRAQLHEVHVTQAREVSGFPHPSLWSTFRHIFRVTITYRKPEKRTKKLWIPVWRSYGAN